MDHIRSLLAAIAAMQLQRVRDWHDAEPALRDPTSLACDAAGMAEEQHKANFLLWHVEDEARRTDVGDDVIADCKRRIDRLNQRRNDLIEAVDAALTEALEPLLPPLPAGAAPRYNTETVGSALDRLSILALKVYHMEQEARRAQAGAAHMAASAAKAQRLREQHAALLRSALELLDDYAAGVKRPRAYHQFKMYNDPSLNPALYGSCTEE